MSMTQQYESFEFKKGQVYKMCCSCNYNTAIIKDTKTQKDRYVVKHSEEIYCVNKNCTYHQPDQPPNIWYEDKEERYGY